MVESCCLHIATSLFIIKPSLAKVPLTAEEFLSASGYHSLLVTHECKKNSVPVTNFIVFFPIVLPVKVMILF